MDVVTGLCDKAPFIYKVVQHDFQVHRNIFKISHKENRKCFAFNREQNKATSCQIMSSRLQNVFKKAIKTKATNV